MKKFGPWIPQQKRAYADCFGPESCMQESILEVLKKASQKSELNPNKIFCDVAENRKPRFRKYSSYRPFLVPESLKDTEILCLSIWKAAVLFQDQQTS